MFEKVSIRQSFIKFLAPSDSIRFEFEFCAGSLQPGSALRIGEPLELPSVVCRSDGVAMDGIGPSKHTTHDTPLETPPYFTRGALLEVLCGNSMGIIRCKVRYSGYRYSGHFNSIKFKVFGHGTAA